MYKRTLLSTALALALTSFVSAASAEDLTNPLSVTDENSTVTYESVKIDTGSATTGINVLKKTEGANTGLTLTAKTIDVKFKGLGIASQTNTDSHIPLGVAGPSVTIGSRDTTESITVSGSTGVRALRGNVTLNAKTVSVTGNWGLHVQGNDEGKTHPETLPELIVNADKTTVNAEKGLGLIAWSGGRMKISGDLELKAMNAIDTRGNSEVVINEDGKGEVQITGDVGFETPGPGDGKSGSLLDSTVKINLVGENSFWTGNIYTDAPSTLTEEQRAERGKVTGFTLKLADGAQWNVTDTMPASGTAVANTHSQFERQNLNKLNFSGGVINLTASSDQKLEIENVEGKGGTVNVKAEKADAGLKSAKLNFENVTGDAPKITEKYSGITADDLSSDKAADLDTLRAVTVANSTKGVELTQVVPEGEVVGELTRTTTADGTVGDIVDSTVKPDDGTAGGEVVEKPNTRQEAFREMAAMGALAWRHETNDLTKRMGELRDSPEGIGTWARLYGSSMDYGDQNLTTRSNSIQVGADADAGKGWKVGAAFSYTDSEMTYDAGSGDGDTYALAVYGTWFGENGQFVDLIGKYSRMSNDFSLNGFDGSYDNNALSLSAEFGWRFPLAKQGFIEPQAELTYGRIFGDDFNSAKGTRIEQDDFDSLIGRIGVRAGWKFAEDRGVVYARVSGLYDFLGDYDYTAKTSSVSRSYTEELGGGWVEYAVGGNFRFTDRSYGYVDVERTSGGEVDEDWRWNVGFRYVW